jgi:predicted nucleic acid-binding Zn ribbon protein
VQRALRQLRDIGLTEQLPRKGTPRHWATGYRLIFGPDLLDKTDVPSPATEAAAIEQLTARRRGRHREPRTARHVDDVQNDDCTTPDATTARHHPRADLREWHPTLHVPLPNPNPPSARADVVARGTGSTRARASNDGDSDISGRQPARRTLPGGNPAADHQQAELDRLKAWMAAQASEPAAAVNGATPDRQCAGCGRAIGDGKRPDATYCIARCKNRATKRRARKTRTEGKRP